MLHCISHVGIFTVRVGMLCVHMSCWHFVHAVSMLCLHDDILCLHDGMLCMNIGMLCMNIGMLCMNIDMLCMHVGIVSSINAINMLEILCMLNLTQITPHRAAHSSVSRTKLLPM